MRFVGKACVRYFLSNFYFFPQMTVLQKLKNVFFILSKELFSFSRYSSFSLSFLTFQSWNLQGWNSPPPIFLRTIQIGACKLYYMYYSLKCRCYVSYCTKSIENIIIITFYTFRLNSVFTTDSLDRHCHVMYFIFAMQEERT